MRPTASKKEPHGSKKDPRSLQMRPQGSHNDPQGIKNEAQRSPDDPRGLPKERQGAQKAPKGNQKGAQRTQEGAQGTPGRSNDPPKSILAPFWTPFAAQNALQDAQECSRGALARDLERLGRPAGQVYSNAPRIPPGQAWARNSLTAARQQGRTNSMFEGVPKHQKRVPERPK